jgi:hypothetical protein
MSRARLLLSTFAGFAVLALASCDSAAPPILAPTASPEVALPPQGLLGNLTLMQCTPVTADSTTQAVGSGGGTIDVGSHRLTIPAGALDSTVVITAIAPSDTLSRVQLFPEGLAFDEPATLRLSYAHCSGVGTLLPRRVVYLGDDLSILEVLLSFTNLLNRTVSGRLDHFSDYAVAW